MRIKVRKNLIELFGVPQHEFLPFRELAGKTLEVFKTLDDDWVKIKDDNYSYDGIKLYKDWVELTMDQKLDKILDE